MTQRLATGRQGTGELDLQAILSSISEPAIIINSDYVIRAANTAYRDAYGTCAEVCGRRCFEMSHGYEVSCDQAGESCPILHSRETGEPSRVLHVHFSNRGRRLEEVEVHPIPDAGGRVEHFLEILREAGVSQQLQQGGRFVGEAPAFKRALELAARVAPRETTVLLLGESGTGKELMAQAVHELSPRAEKPFVPVDCSGLSESLFESELFGHEKGSFTGAAQRKIGLIEACGSGTLFLDEIGDIPLALQVKLLRLLETGDFRRVGSTERMKANFRLICATHRDLRTMVEDGSFRRDLFYRISAFPIRLPPLRERLEDLPLLIDCLRHRLGFNASVKIAPKALEVLRRYAFPGNVRELLNILERALLLMDGDTVLPEHLTEECRAGGAGSEPPASGEIVSLEEQERRYLLWATERFEGDNSALAERLGLSERTFYRKVSKLRDGQ